MSVSVHNPDQYMSSMRTLVAQGKKRIGLLIGAGAPASMPKADGSFPLIPTVATLTDEVLLALSATYAKQIEALKSELDKNDIETILSRIRALSKVLGPSKHHDLDGPGYEKFGQTICAEIGKKVDVRLPKGETAYSNLVNWVAGTSRDYPVEIFTTNYDLLLEEAFEAVRAPYFDGFAGACEPFFDPVSVAGNDLPARWTRIWKLHGSLGWSAGAADSVVRTGNRSSTHLVFPEHLKYDQTQKAPYTALLDRLRSFLSVEDTLLISVGFSYADAHVAARIDEGLAGNPSASVFAFMFGPLDGEVAACDLASKRPNFSVYCPDKAMMNGTKGAWVLPPDLPSKDWGPIRATYWGAAAPGKPAQFLLGSADAFCKFLAASRAPQALSQSPAPVVTES